MDSDTTKDPPFPTKLVPTERQISSNSCFLKFFQPNLYPTVGLQTPGEIVDANFGQQPFVFDIEDYMSEWRAKILGMIARFPIGERLGEWQGVLQK